ncbi:ABC-type transport system substrate-binding protein [Catenuloplanes nepalensis]|uniref:ABC-type transport system substrate-binding protein n=1 Tax=Catenuloplanes nepalensis TaxID=587533 RepID=A0ABT9N170_9ACTN|nr:hypothetical protein [Catenuloplanes nepalensis]MDP9797238.1 ABC-type transport system substrate-binding protein [Catenuloplanes nepalensis]
MTRRIALALLMFAALLGAGATAAYAADNVTVNVSVPEGASEPTPSTTPTSTDPANGNGNLPDTGRPILFILGAAAVLIVAGAGLMALGRRSGKSHRPI